MSWALGVAFISLRDGFDLTTPGGRAMFQMVAVMAEFERSLIRERVKAGIALVRVKGQKLGRPRKSGGQSDDDLTPAAHGPIVTTAR